MADFIITKPESPVLALMRDAGIPVTRENYLYLNYMGSPPSEEDWSYEDEAELPEELQDFSRLERRRRRRRR